MKRNLFYLSFLLLLATFGCAQQGGNALEPTGEVAAAGEVADDEIEALLEDGFFDEEGGSDPVYYDPLEPVNRVFFAFNDKLYFWVLKPVNVAYSAVLPFDIRFAIGNFFSNMAAPVRIINSLLQGKLENAGIVLSRFVINSTLGVYGLGDAAQRQFGLMPKQEDFGQTLGYWGLGEGMYICWPIIGPSNVRDSLGFLGDAYTHPVVYFINDFMFSSGYYIESRVNLLSLNPEIYEDLKKYSLDPYISMRQVYLDYRRQKIEDSDTLQRSDNEL
ncbi:MAG: VacJ family lipoprotein [Thermodesulfobacteriota bacterium]